MAHSDDRSPSEKTLSDQIPASPTESRIDSGTLPFLPSHTLSEAEARRALKNGEPELRLALIAELISFAPWEVIWTFISREELKETLPDLDLPAPLAESWRRYLL